MGKGNFSDDFKRDAVRQITERGYPVAEVSQRLGVSQHSLYVWTKLFGKPAGAGEGAQAAEVSRLKRELVRVSLAVVTANAQRGSSMIWLNASPIASSLPATAIRPILKPSRARLAPMWIMRNL
jgi:transposase